MDPNDLAESYNKLASHWDGESFNRENGIAQHRRALQFASKKGNAIDIGCGSSGRLISLLSAAGFEVEGLDISPEMIRLAQARHPHHVFHLANICEWIFPKRYDFISAWDSIWHVPLRFHEQLLVKLCGGLHHQGVMIFTSGGLESPSEGTNPCLGQPLYHATLGIPKVLETISECGCICRHLEYDQYPEKHLYLIVQKFEPLGKSDADCRPDLR